MDVSYMYESDELGISFKKAFSSLNILWSYG